MNFIKIFRLVLFVISVFCMGVSNVLANDASPEKLLFYDSFDSLEKIIANGGKIKGAVEIVKGWRGNGIKLQGEEALVEYPGEARISMAKGSIEFMIKSDWRFNAEGSEKDNPYILVADPFFFCFSLRHHPGNNLSVTGGDQPVYNTVWYSGNVIGFMAGEPEKGTPTHLRFDLSRKGISDWTQVGLSWNFTGPPNTREIRLYINGVFAGTTRYTGQLPDRLPAIYVGGRPGYASHVSIDELKIWAEPKNYEVNELE